VDAASGGFIAPFIQPDLEWDFRLPLVKSINTSGHKFGLVFAGIGWIIFREPQDLPADLVFHVNYLGGDQASFTLNFSKGAGTILAQYYQFVRLGFDGYKAVMINSMATSEYLRNRLMETGRFDIIDKANMPLVAFALKDDSSFSVFDLQERLKGHGWIVPAYTCPTGATNLKIMRVVVKQNFSYDMADLLIKDIQAAFVYLDHAHPANKEIHEAATKKAWVAQHQWRVQHNTVRVQETPQTTANKSEPVMHKDTGNKTTGVC